jgi:3-oxoacyl-[acyl-carrier-protein] synthase-3
VTAKLITHPTPIAVLATGSALPGNYLNTTDLLALLSDYLPTRIRSRALRVAEKLGIETRHFSRPFTQSIEKPNTADSAPRLVARALLAALTSSDLDVNDLTMLIGHTTTPHSLLPSNAAWVAEELGFRGPHIELRQACTGFSAGAMCAASLIDGGSSSIAVAGSEVGSVMLDLNRIAEDPAQLVNVLQMGDGAGAAILGPYQQDRQSRLECMFYGSLNGFHAPAISLPHGGSGSPVVPGPGILHFDHDYAAIRDHGIELIGAGLEAALALGVERGSVDWWIPQQVNGRMADICASHLGVPEERVIVEAGALGNLGSAAMWVALDRLRRSGRLRRGDRVLVLGAEASKFMYGGFLYTHGDESREPV